MTPETLRIDRTFKGVGRIAKATGTTNPVVRRKMSRMLTALYEDGKLDVLRALRDGDLAFMQVFAAYQAHTVDALPTAATIKPLGPTMQAWIDGLRVPDDVSQDHKESLETSKRYFEGERKAATVNDLPTVLEALRDSLGVRHPRSFNLARAAALAFVRDKFKRSHPLYSAVLAVEPRKVVKKRAAAPLTLEQLGELFPSPDTDPVDAIAWGMATTGMHAREYWGRWHVAKDRIHVAGTKRSGRVRDVPLLERPRVPSMHRRTWEDKIRERTSAITPYDLRRTYANLLEAAGIPRTRRKLYLGHGVTDVTDLYERHQVDAFLLEDAGKLKALFDASPTKLHTVALHVDHEVRRAN